MFDKFSRDITRRLREKKRWCIIYAMKGWINRNCAEFTQFENSGITLKQNRIGLLGGTFNPVHNGHLAMANIAYCEFLLGQVLFLPLGDPPHKRNDHIAPAQQRLDMISLAVEDSPQYSISALEIMREGLTYTVDTLEMLTKQNKDAQFFYIIGADTLFELHSWKTFERVIALTSFICIPRPGVDAQKVADYASVLNERYGQKIFIASESGPDIASTEIRALAGQNLLANTLVPEKVRNYIKRNQIYATRTK